MIDIKGSIKAKTITPLHCWDVYAIQLAEQNQKLKDNKEIQSLLDFQTRFRWKIDLEKILTKQYDALVLTDNKVKIKWVTSGFRHMTGYTKAEVINMSPKILQGNGTSLESKRRLAENIFHQKPFKQSLVNYRKNNEEYICIIEVFPLFNENNELCHFLALEREVNNVTDKENI